MGGGSLVDPKVSRFLGLELGQMLMLNVFWWALRLYAGVTDSAHGRGRELLPIPLPHRVGYLRISASASKIVIPTTMSQIHWFGLNFQ
jgi:hypothetical protein